MNITSLNLFDEHGTILTKCFYIIRTVILNMHMLRSTRAVVIFIKEQQGVRRASNVLAGGELRT